MTESKILSFSVVEMFSSIPSDIGTFVAKWVIILLGISRLIIRQGFNDRCNLVKKIYLQIWGKWTPITNSRGLNKWIINSVPEVICEEWQMRSCQPGRPCLDRERLLQKWKPCVDERCLIVTWEFSWIINTELIVGKTQIKTWHTKE